jgi:hypothetical protein
MIGCDFEVFVFDKNNNLVNCSELIPQYSKKTPLIINNYLITHDSYCLECSIPPFNLNGTFLQFYNEINKGINILKGFLKNYGDYTIKFKDFIKLSDLQEFDKGFEQNIYNIENLEYSKKIKTNITTAGLHIHFDSINNTKQFIKKLDRTIGLFYKITNIFSKRREYGKFGSYRDKQYTNLIRGFEYRVLGGNMLKKLNLILLSIYVCKLKQELDN